FDIRHDHSEHLFMDVNSRYPVHKSSWRERRACRKLPSTRVTGYRRSCRGRGQCPIIRSTRTLRIRQYNGLDVSTDVVNLASPTFTYFALALNNFHKLSRAVGPLGQYRSNRESACHLPLWRSSVLVAWRSGKTCSATAHRSVPWPAPLPPERDASTHY